MEDILEQFITFTCVIMQWHKDIKRTCLRHGRNFYDSRFFSSLFLKLKFSSLTCVSDSCGLGLLGEKWDALERYCVGFSKDWGRTWKRDLLQVTKKTKHTGFRKSPEQKVVGSWKGIEEKGHNAYPVLTLSCAPIYAHCWKQDTRLYKGSV